MNWTHIAVLIVAFIVGAYIGTHKPGLFGPLQGAVTG